LRFEPSLLLSPAAPRADAAPAAPPIGGGRPKLLFLVTEDWYFCSHRLPAARAARDAGFEVVVATRVRAHAEAIRDEGFALRPLPWRRRGDGPFGGLRALAAIVRLYRAERPDLLHHVALKPVLFGGLAARLAFARHGRPAVLAAVMGMGSGFAGRGWTRYALALGLRLAGGGRVIVQNPEDGAALGRLGVAPERIALIRGSGVDTGHFVPAPEPPGPTIALALVARMLRSKGVLDAAAAVRRLRGEGHAVELLLAGPADPDNPDSLDEPSLRALAAEPGIEWLGPVADVREVWARAAIALLPSTYGEGLPKALLEAAACGRPMVATDTPGCREIARDGETGVLVPAADVAALAAAIAALARDPARRQALGRAARALAEHDFAEPVIAAQTLVLYRTMLAEKRGSA
jgi:glycosyltransferase involved in cell wall biosynthesis